MDELDAFVHQSTFLSPARTGKPMGEVELCVLCGEGGRCYEDGTAILTRAISGRFSLTLPVLPEHCTHIPCPQEVQGVQCAIPGFSSYAPVLHGQPESVCQECPVPW